MPKRKRKAPPPPKPGLAHQHLIDVYPSIPDDRHLLLNGHILRLFLQNDRSVSRTIRSVCAALTVACTINPNHMTSIINSFNSMKNLGREKEMERFVEFCSQPFLFAFEKQASPTPMDVSVDEPATSSLGLDSPLRTEPEPEPPSEKTKTPASPALMFDLSSCSQPMDISFDQPAMPTSTPCNDQEPVTPYPLRQGILTPRKLTLKKRLVFVSKQHSLQKKRHLKQVRSFRSNIDFLRKNEMKYMNQDVKRKKLSMKTKDATIAMLKKQMKETDIGRVTQELNQLRRTHQRLLESNEEKRKRKKSVSVPKADFLKLKKELSEKNDKIRCLENEKVEAEDRIAEVDNQSKEKETKKDGKTYGLNMRMMVYDAIVDQVPTQNIPSLIQSYAKRNGDNLTAVPHRTTVEQMTRELDSIADLKTAEMAMKVKDLTLGFDATTQEGTHINSIHLTSKTDCDVVAIDELPGGTADDYSDHIVSSVDNLADVYRDFHKDEFQYCRSRIIDNIANTMNDRVTVNHATIRKVNEAWDKTLNELNCHLHPLDTIASTCRSVLRSLETTKGELFGKDCFAGNIVLQVNKLRYKDGKGDPKGFKTFLGDHKLPRGIIPRYRGNRLHILFHICGKLFEHYDLFLTFFKTGAVSCGGLVASLRKDFEGKPAIVEMQVLGLLGKLFSGPWMKLFYTSAQSTLSHVDGIAVVKDVIVTLRETVTNTMSLLDRTTDFFGNSLCEKDATLEKLRSPPADKDFFVATISACMNAIITVLERQYKRYFEMEITDKLREETLSARSHNIDAEEVMGMFSAGKDRAKNANVDFLAARMRAKKNKVVPWLDEMYDDKKESIVSWAIGRARKKRKVNRKKDSEMRKEMSRRAANKRQKKDQKERKDYEKQLKGADIGKLRSIFPDISDEMHSDLVDILQGTIVGRSICHTWYDEENAEKTVYSGKVEKLKKRKGNIFCYRISYWSEEETYEDATDYDIQKLAIAADLLCEDLVLC